MGCLCVVLINTAIPCGAQSIASQPSASYDLKNQALSDLRGLEQKFVDLANCVPVDKLSWRPSPESRSFAEVFLHIAAERYVILGLAGVPVPAGFEKMIQQKSTTDFEKSTPGDRARIAEELNKSWEFSGRTLNAMFSGDLTKPLPKPGRQTNIGDLVYLLVADQHEHLGQAVAYARANGIVPPWTAHAQTPPAGKTTHRK